MGETIKNIISERKLSFIKETGEYFKCRLVLGAPQEDPENGIACEYQILGYGDEKIRVSHGEDYIEAFLRAVQIANVLLTHRYDEGIFLCYDYPELWLDVKNLADTTILKHKLTFTHNSGQKLDCLLKIEQPYFTQSEDWVCHFEITGYGSQECIAAHGTDGLHALISAFELIKVEIDKLSSEGHFLEDELSALSILGKKISA